MADLLNEIIALGGTTAHQSPTSVEAVRPIAGLELLAAMVAEDQGRVIGWQSVEMWQAEAHGGTFVQPGTQAKGVGAAMFAMTREVVRLAGVRAIIASIRADNVPGLAYYGRMGFVEFARDPEFALNDGRVVGRVHWRFDLV